MSSLNDIVAFCEELLSVSTVPDAWCANGLQVEGKKEVHKIALGVSTSEAFLKMAIAWEADMCLVHHGLFWKKGEVKILGVLKNRLKLILENNISLVNFHIPLDAHPEIGNNAALIEMLGLKKLAPVGCGFMAEYEQEMPFADFKKLVTEKISPINFSADFHGDMVKKVGVVSGGADSFAAEVHAAGADTFLFGELSEHGYHDIKEMGLNFIAAGHFATERYGVQRLGEKIIQKFSDVEVQFFDEDCPV